MVRRRDEQCPIGRMGDAWDVAYAALFLASDEAKYITGASWSSMAGSRSTASEAVLNAYQRTRYCQIKGYRAEGAPRRNTQSLCANRISPLIRRLGSEDPECRTRDQMASKVEGVVDRGMMSSFLRSWPMVS